MPIRTVLFEDHEVSRIALRLTLQEHGDFEIVGEAEDGFSAVTIFESTRPDLVITELWLPHVNGVEVIRQMVGLKASAPILVMSSYHSDENVLNSFLAGADGFCAKDASKEELLQAVDGVLDGELWFDRSCFTRLIEAAGIKVMEPLLPPVAWSYLNGQSLKSISQDTGVDVPELCSKLRSQLKALMGRNA